ncbi:taste receptor type 1 member 1-like [Engraulis encrasicolus]|uniref:taste receptor type 1 member 1-like n=1 Tax=Engraulis encrasicolus TaxID=184585 RepID=UPI002FD581C7
MGSRRRRVPCPMLLGDGTMFLTLSPLLLLMTISSLLLNHHGSCQSSEFNIDGDFMLGGLFPVHYNPGAPQTSRPEVGNCLKNPVSVKGYRALQVMRFAVEEVSNSTSILPNVTLGYQIFDHCTDGHNFPAVLRVRSSNGSVTAGQRQRLDDNNFIAFIGAYSSTESMSLAPMLMMDMFPMVSYSATTSTLSDKLVYPSFMRTVPTSKAEMRLIVQIIKHFGWNWVAFLASVSDYSVNGLELFVEQTQNTSICLAYYEHLNAASHLKQVFDKLNMLNVNVIILFIEPQMAVNIVTSALKHNFHHKVWIASDAWALNQQLLKLHGLSKIGSVIGVTPTQVTLPGFEEFIYQFHHGGDSFADKGTCNQECVNCSLIKPDDVINSDPAYSFPIYSAVYTMAMALHNALHCNQSGCNKSETVLPYKVPFSNCSVECEAGYVRQQDGIHECCYTCHKCPINYYANHTADLYSCMACEISQWSEAGSTSCHQRSVEYMYLSDSHSIVLIVLLSLLLLLCVGVAVLFFLHRSTPVVRSAGGSMCYLMLSCIAASTVSVFFHIGQPTTIACALINPGYIFFYTVCMSCLFVRSFQIICVFKMATHLPRAHALWVKHSGQWLVVAAISLLQLLLCVIWTAVSPTLPTEDTTSFQHQIVLRCAGKNDAVSYLALVLLWLISGLCFCFSYMGTDLPKNYNEAKGITFSVMLFCLCWAIFFTSEIVSKSKYVQVVKAVVEMCCLCGIMFSYFAPKCCIILFQPAKNTQEYFQASIQSYTQTISRM